MEILVIIFSAKNSVNRDRLLFLRIIIIIIIIITDASAGKAFGCNCMQTRPMVKTMESDRLASFVC